MGCIIEFSDPFIRFEFYKSKYKQKTLVDVLLNYTKLGIGDLAFSVGVSTEMLCNVHSGSDFLQERAADILAQIFLLAFSD